MNDKFITNPVSKERNLSIDILKLFLSFAVVGLHGNIFQDFSPFLSYLFVNGLARIAVPVFLIISGFYFFEIKSRKQFLNWIKRLMILYLLWMLIYGVFWIEPKRGVIIRLIIGYFHLWFLIGAVEAFILLWFLRNIKTRNLLIITILCALSGLLLQYNHRYHFTEIFNLLYNFVSNASYRNGLFFCFPFIVIGYLINKYKIIDKWKNIKIAFISSLILLTVESCLNYKYSGFFFDILFSLYLICPLLFICVSSIKCYSKNKSLSYYSTGIYLVHFFVQRILSSNHITKYIALSETPKVVLTILLSALITYFLIIARKKFKYIL
ncbi:MAG: acyltransferase [Bacteroidales bacterium]|jgi:fucose 4-O-acetylase-like acetyltransferase|nr:acyltransferase [Bacteroidales bacterium]